MAEHGVCTNVAIQQLLVAEHIQEMKRHRGKEDDTAVSVGLFSPSIRIISSMRRRFIQPDNDVPSHSTVSTILDDDKCLTRSFRLRRDENLQKIAWLQPVDKTIENQSSNQPDHHRSRLEELFTIFHEERSTNNERPQRRFSLFDCLPDTLPLNRSNSCV